MEKQVIFYAKWMQSILMLIKKEQFMFKCSNFVDLAHDHQLAHTQKYELFELFEQHGDNLTKSVQLVNNFSHFGIKTDHLAQKAQKAQRNHMGSIEQHDEQDGLPKNDVIFLLQKESTCLSHYYIEY